MQHTNHEPERGCVVLDQPQRVGSTNIVRFISATPHCEAAAAGLRHSRAPLPSLIAISSCAKKTLEAAANKPTLWRKNELKKQFALSQRIKRRSPN